MLISANIIKKPIKSRICDDCHKVINGATLRLYGGGEVQNKPSVLYLHPDCTSWDHPKILEAKKAL